MISEIKCYLRAVGTRGLFSAISGKITNTSTLLQIDRPDIRFPLYLRVPSTDVPTFDQVFVKQEYAFTVKRTPKFIIDAGANIGLASIYFANRFPEATIIAIEPEEGNLGLLRKNIAAYRNILPIPAALWCENTPINLVDPGVGEWGYRTEVRDGVQNRYGRLVREVQGMTVDRIMEEQGISHVDILKIDIEGAEREVFVDPSAWIGKIDALIVELHEFNVPGCSSNFRKSSSGFDSKWKQGENVFLTRSKGCLTRP